jgi:hypothetical protein
MAKRSGIRGVKKEEERFLSRQADPQERKGKKKRRLVPFEMTVWAAEEKS